jgi:hypothetical protein
MLIQYCGQKLSNEEELNRALSSGHSKIVRHRERKASH